MASETAERAGRLTRKILQFSNRQPTDMRPLRIGHVVSEMAAMVGRFLGENTTAELELTDEPHTVLADEGCIEQVILNLALNARDAMPDGGVLKIRTEGLFPADPSGLPDHVDPEGEFVRLSVEDSGTGMDSEVVEHLFEPFFTTKEPGTGTGLGLSVVFGIVKQHGGWIDVQTEPGRGSSFHLYFPVGLEKTEAAVRPEPAPFDTAGRGERILLAEDDGGVREFTASVLTDAGYEVVAVGDGRDAVEKFRSDRNFDLLFIDIALPRLSGVEVVGKILTETPAIKVVLTSGYGHLKSRWTTILREGFRFLRKPYGMTALLKTVRESLDDD
ncbi:MAG: ATP-binding protein [Planctomycetota bacterium]|jgi:CheY-like chemotaxis protein